MNRLANKVAIITGGASGIGAGTVRRFVEEGAKVVIADIQDDLGKALVAELGQNAIYQHTNVATEADVERMVDLAVNHFGHLDILFNNAGFGGVSGELQDLVPSTTLAISISYLIMLASAASAVSFKTW